MPVTAPTANVTATTFDQRRASSSATSSSLRRPRQLAISMIAGNATPIDARMMWKPSVNAIWLLAAVSSEASGTIACIAVRWRPRGPAPGTSASSQSIRAASERSRTCGPRAF